MQAQTPRRLIAVTRSKALGRLVGGVGEREHDAGVVEGHVEPAELGDGAIDQRGDLVLVGDVAGDAERTVAGGGQLVGRGAQRLLVDVGEHDRGARGGEGAGGVEAHAGAGAGDERDLAAEVVGRVHADRPPPYCSSLTCSPQVTGLPVSSFCCMAMWTMKRFGAAPCQWFSPGSKKTRSPGRISSIGPPSRWQQADALGDEDRLAVRVGVPGGARAGREVHERGGERRRRLGRGDGVDVDVAGEPVGGALLGLDAAAGDLHVGAPSSR